MTRQWNRKTTRTRSSCVTVEFLEPRCCMDSDWINSPAVSTDETKNSHDDASVLVGDFVDDLPEASSLPKFVSPEDISPEDMGEYTSYAMDEESLPFCESLPKESTGEACYPVDPDALTNSLDPFIGIPEISIPSRAQGQSPSPSASPVSARPDPAESPIQESPIVGPKTAERPLLAQVAPMEFVPQKPLNTTQSVATPAPAIPGLGPGNEFKHSTEFRDISKQLSRNSAFKASNANMPTNSDAPRITYDRVSGASNKSKVLRPNIVEVLPLASARTDRNTAKKSPERKDRAVSNPTDPLTKAPKTHQSPLWNSDRQAAGMEIPEKPPERSTELRVEGSINPTAERINDALTISLESEETVQPSWFRPWFAWLGLTTICLSQSSAVSRFLQKRHWGTFDNRWHR